MSKIFFVEQKDNVWFVYGLIGIRRYVNITEKQAQENYLAECERNLFRLKVVL